MKKHVLMLTHQRAGIGGSFMRAVSLATPLVESGWEVTLLASRAEIGLRTTRSDWHGVRVVQMPDLFPERIRNAGFSPLDLAARLVHVHFHTYDIIHSFDHRPCAALPGLLRPDRRIPFISDWADLWGRDGLAGQRSGWTNIFLSYFDDNWEPFVRRRSSAVTAISTELAHRALALGLDPQRVRLVPVGSNSDVVRPLDKRSARLKYGIAADVPVVAYCGIASFDAELLADSFVELAKLVPRAVIVISGAPLPALNATLQRHGLRERLRHFGLVPYEQLGEVLSCGDVMLLPQRDTLVNTARFPNRLGDYLAAGRPVAITRVGDQALLVQREGLGVVTDSDPRSFAAGIAALLADADGCNEMGLRARRLAETQFSWRTVAQAVAGLYDELLS